MYGIPIFFVFFLLLFFVLKSSKKAMKHMILSFKMKGDVISDHFLKLWFQKDFIKWKEEDGRGGEGEIEND